jgi:hypothetical protein
VSWVPAQGQQAGLDLIILVDDALDSSVGIQLDPLAKFIRSLPPTTRVAVAYARNGNALLQQNLTDDHEAAAKALRITLGNPGAGGSPYLSLIDLLNRIPPGSNRRAVLFISDGIDLSAGLGLFAGSNFDLHGRLTGRSASTPRSSRSSPAAPDACGATPSWWATARARSRAWRRRPAATASSRASARR